MPEPALRGPQPNEDDGTPFWLSRRPFQEPVYPDGAWTDASDDE